MLCTFNFVTCKLHKDGVGVVKNSAKVITCEHEDAFWKTGVLRALQRFLNFVVRGVKEQYDLVPSEFQRVPTHYSVYNDFVYYEYHEFMLKTISTDSRT